jgi:electron transfer flavoprotein alpha subunit
MSKVLIVAEHAAGALNLSTAKSLSCARALGDAEVDILVLAADAAPVAAAAAVLAGVRQPC